ncbi:MAG TPA: hypothetical protein EYO45_04785 [Candidatus Marinimicrobia bacterium]|nr:hypothetical protein [Candidatus Neomarinimicrobiota bacterium]HIB32408.1 hypothetical protein [Candidatus Neomarinimicrobiota bacterium]
MNSVVLALAGFIFFFLGYRFYSTFIANRIFGLHEFSGPTPAEELEDGIDFFPRINMFFSGIISHPFLVLPQLSGLALLSIGDGCLHCSGSY